MRDIPTENATAYTDMKIVYCPFSRKAFLTF